MSSDSRPQPGTPDVAHRNDREWLTGGGEMGRAVRAFDWSATPLGARHLWPQSLRSAVSLCLHNRFPIFLWWGPELINLYNDAYIPILGKRHPEGLGSRARELWQDVWPAIEPQVRAVFDKGEASWQERLLLVTNRNGYEEDAYFTYSHSPAFDEHGNVAGLLCVVAEETAQVLAAETLRRTEARQAYLLSLSDAIRNLRDPEAIKAAASAVLGDHLRVQRVVYAEVDGDDWVLEGGYSKGAEPLKPGRYSADIYGHRTMATYRSGRNLVYRDTRSDVDLAPAERDAHAAIGILGAVGVPLIKEGNLVAILAVHSTAPRSWTDEEINLVQETAERTWAAVERAHAEHGLRHSEERYRAFISRSSEGIWRFELRAPLPVTLPVDDQVKHTYEHAYLAECNDAYARMYGYVAAHELEGTPLAAFLPPTEPQNIAYIRTFIESNYQLTGVETRELARDGSLRIMRNSIVGIVENGFVLRAWGTQQDVTDQRLAEDELLRMNRELEEFAYVASHDLQEPLRMVGIYTQLILRRIGKNPELDEFGAFVRQGVNRMELLIRDLLTYSRTVQREEAPVGTADLTASLDEARDVLKSRIEETGAKIHAEPLPRVRGDTRQYAHVFQNLLSNALKYRQPHVAPEVRITREPQGQQWVIAIKDNGIGFEPQHAQRIFGLFKRLHKDEYPGTGLGLAICQRIVERYGGRIWADARPGEGAVFFMALPGADGEQPYRSRTSDSG